MNQYDDPAFFAAYVQMSRSQYGLDAAVEWHLQPDDKRMNLKTPGIL